MEVVLLLIMYCPNCNQDVLTKREDFSYLLAFLLAFTGLGLVIYILYYIDKKKDRCVHCENKCQPRRLIENHIGSNIHLQNESGDSLEYKSVKLEENKISFCHNCGVELGDREDINYCALCGSNVN